MPNSALNTTVKQTVLASNSRRFAPWTSLARALTLRLNCFLDLSNLSPGCRRPNRAGSHRSSSPNGRRMGT